MRGAQALGHTQDFVLAEGCQELAGYTALVGRDGTRRLLAELSADPDRPEARPGEAYRELLASLVPGWTLRLLQVTWPDLGPRRALLAQVDAWGEKPPTSSGTGEQLSALRQGLQLFLEAFPLPYRQRVILEFVLPPGTEGLGWWSGLAGTLASYGLVFTPLDREAIVALARHLLNPELE